MALTSTQLGGGTFTGRALYDTSVFPDSVYQDVSDIISMISPTETPILSLLGDSDFPAKSVLHEWLEEELSPNTLTTTTPLTAVNTVFAISSGYAQYVMNGAILKIGDEYCQINGISGNNITVERGYAGTTAVSTALLTFSVISDAAVEGADVTDDISRPRVRLSNNCMIFKKDVIVSGTTRSVSMIGVEDELDHQVRNRTREALRDLEKAVILSRAAANTLGSATVTRTMKGLRQMIATNSTSLPAISNTALTAVMKLAWDQGGSDIDTIICGQTVKQQLDLLNSTMKRTTNDTSAVRDLVSQYEGTYGLVNIVMSRWMPANEGIVIASNRIRVVPLATRSFAYVPTAKTGDSDKGMVIGEYTLEVRNEAGMAKFNL